MADFKRATVRFNLPSGTGPFSVTFPDTWTPKAFIANLTNVNQPQDDGLNIHSRICVGMSDGVRQRCEQVMLNNGSAPLTSTARAHRKDLALAISTSNFADIKTVSAVGAGNGPKPGGWDMTVTFAGSSWNRECQITFFGGDDVDAYVNDFTPQQIQDTTRLVTDPGHQTSVVLMASVGWVQENTEPFLVNSPMIFGCAADTNDFGIVNVGAAASSQDSLAESSNSQMVKDNRIPGLLNFEGVELYNMEVTAFTPTGFNVTTRDSSIATNYAVSYLSLSFEEGPNPGEVDVWAGVYQTPTSGPVFNPPQPNFEPAFGILHGMSRTEINVPGASGHPCRAFGMTDGTVESAQATLSRDGVSPMEEASAAAPALYQNWNPIDQSLRCELRGVTFDSVDFFKVNVTQADTAGRWMWGLFIGEGAAAGPVVSSIGVGGGRDYSSIQAWHDDGYGGAVGVPAIGQIHFEDGDLEITSTISLTNSSPSAITLMAAPGSEPLGLTSGSAIKAAAGFGGGPMLLANVGAAGGPKVFSDLHFDANGQNVAGFIVNLVDPGPDNRIQRCVFHGVSTAGTPAASVIDIDQGWSIVNNMLVDVVVPTNLLGIRVDKATTPSYIANNTLTNLESSSGTCIGIAYLDDVRTDLHNNLVTDVRATGTDRCYNIDTPSLANTSNNLSSDATSPNSDHRNAVITFEDASKSIYYLGAFDAAAIDQGTNLGDTSASQGANIDVLLRDRFAEGDVWDIGAHEFTGVVAPPVDGDGSVFLNALTVDGTANREVNTTSAAVTLNALSVRGDGFISAEGDGSVFLNALTVDGTANREVPADASVNLNALSVKGFGDIETGEVEGSGQVFLNALHVSGDANREAVADAAVSLNAMSVKGFGFTVGETEGSGSVFLNALTVDGQANRVVTAQAAVRLNALSVKGFGSIPTPIRIATSKPVPPTRQHSFTDHSVNTPDVPHRGDQIDREYDNGYDFDNDVVRWVEVSLDDQGNIKANAVGEEQLQEGLFDEISDDIREDLEPLVDEAQAAANASEQSARRSESSASQAATSANQANFAKTSAETAAENAEASEVSADRSARDAEAAVPTTNTNANRAELSAAESELDRQQARKWAEFLAGPVELLPEEEDEPGFNQSVDDGFYSSKFWAQYAFDAARGVSRFYLGAFPAPPTQTPDPDPQPLQPGMLYYNTVDDVLYVWDGSTWKPLPQAVPSALDRFEYVLSAGQTRVGGADINGNTPVLDPDKNFYNVVQNGVQLVIAPHPNGGEYTLDYDTDEVVLTAPAAADDTLSLDIWQAVSDITQPVGVAVDILDDLQGDFDGVKQDFPLTIAAAPITATSTSELFIQLDGLEQRPGVDYLLLPPDQVRFITAPTADVEFFGRWVQSVDVSGGGSGLALRVQVLEQQVRALREWACLFGGNRKPPWCP